MYIYIYKYVYIYHFYYLYGIIHREDYFYIFISTVERHIELLGYQSSHRYRERCSLGLLYNEVISCISLLECFNCSNQFLGTHSCFELPALYYWAI